MTRHCFKRLSRCMSKAGGAERSMLSPIEERRTDRSTLDPGICHTLSSAEPCSESDGRSRSVLVCRSSLGALQMTTRSQSSPGHGSFLLCSQGNSPVQAHRAGTRAVREDSPHCTLSSGSLLHTALSVEGIHHHNTSHCFHFSSRTPRWASVSSPAKKLGDPS